MSGGPGRDAAAAGGGAQGGAKTAIAHRFRGFLPVVVDLETGGFDCQTDALLELAAVVIDMDDDGRCHAAQSMAWNLEPFEGGRLDPAALDFTGIDPHDPARAAVAEDEALRELFGNVRAWLRRTGCTQAVLVAHNAHFDLGFLRAAAARCTIKRNPFHSFTCFDTATLAGVALGHTVLARACALAGLDFDNERAHSAKYDSERTAELFCRIANNATPGPAQGGHCGTMPGHSQSP